MKPLTFSDAYGLTLIAKKLSGVDREEIKKYLSSDAQKIAEALINPGAASSKNVKSAAKELQKRIRTAS